MNRHLTLNVILAVLVVLPCAKPQQPVQTASGDSEADSAPSTAPAVTERRLITFHDKRLSLSVSNSPLGSILDELARAGRITIVQTEPVGDTLVSIELKNVTLESGLRQILSGQDAFFLYAGDGDSPASLKTVWVYPKGLARGFQPAPPAWGSLKEIEAKLADPDPSVRIRAYDALLERKGNDAVNDVARLMVEEKNDDVRAQVFSAALSKDVQLPVDLRIALASTDASEGVRILALDTLRGDPNLPAVATAALTDPSPNVRLMAQDLMNSLDASRMPVPDQ